LTEERVHQPKGIIERLDTLRGEVRRTAAAYGLVRLALLLAALVAGTFLLDRLLDLPQAFRAVVLALAAGGIAGGLWVWFMQPVSRASRLTDDDAALMVERQFPLQEELISAVQLARARSTEGDGPRWSPALVNHVVDGAEQRVRSLDFSRAIDRSGLRRAGFAFVVAALVVGGGAALRPAEAGIWLERMVLLRDTPWPREVELEITLEPAGGVVARGDDLMISARAVRGVPSHVDVEPRFEESGDGEPLSMVEARGTWRVVLENLNEPVRLRVSGGDFTSRWIEVEVRARPQVEELRVWASYPGYTGLEDTPPEAPQLDGNLKLPAGTHVRFEARASQALRGVELGFGKPEAIVELEGPELAPLGGDGEPRIVGGAFRVLDTTSWSIDLTSTDGFRSDVAAQWSIRAIADRLPEVRMRKPARNKEVTPQALVPLMAELRDDYGLEAAALVYAVLGRTGDDGSAPTGNGGEAGEGAESGVEQRIALQLVGEGSPERTPREGVVERDFQLGALELKQHDRVLYWVEAVDTRAAGGGITAVEPASRGVSQKYQLQVVSDADMERLLQGRLKRLRDELEQVLRTQRNARKEIDELAAALAGEGAVGQTERRRLTYVELDQRRIGQRLGRARDEVGEVADEMGWNRVGSEADLEWLRGIEAVLGELAGGPAAQAVEWLQTERKRARPQAEGLAQARAMADVVIAKLDDLVRRLDKWDEFNEVLRQMRDLIDQADRVMQGTRARVKKELGQ
jgi:hypothetical protein